jgi:tRNA nucleotidyltransferase (CCA-adding enzyme)
MAQLPAALARARFPPPILDVLQRLDGAGHRSWLVGGAVRDLLLHRRRDAHDFDVATPATPEEVTALFRRVIPTGIAHGTVTVLVADERVEVTTFRGEGAYLDGRRPGSVVFHRDLEADLARRDFTMNALAYDPVGVEFRDPFGGRADMARRLIRAVGEPAERFGEDGLRALRAVRFAAQLGYTLERKTRAAIPGAVGVVRKVSVERVAEELSRLVVAPHAVQGVELLRSTGLMAELLPAVAARGRAEIRHAAAVLGHAPADPAARFAALLHGLPAEDVERVLAGLRLPRRVAEEATALASALRCWRRAPREPLPMAAAAIRRWLSGVGSERVPALLGLLEAEARSMPASSAPRARAEVRRFQRALTSVTSARPPLGAQDLALDGRAVMDLLGTGPGPQVGEALRHLLDRVLDDPSLNTPPALADLVRRWGATRL